MVKGVIFDIGGVLAEDIYDNVFYDDVVGLIHKCAVPETIFRQVVRDLREKYTNIVIGNKENWKEVEKSFWQEFNDSLHVAFPVDELVQTTDLFVRAIGGMPEFARELRQRGMDVLICSDNTEFWFQRQNRLLQLEKYLPEKKIILSNHFGSSKASPGFELFQAVENAMDFEQSDYVFIDDRARNIEMALQFGLPALLFPRASALGASYVRNILRLEG